jgi:hypothetical protein
MFTERRQKESGECRKKLATVNFTLEKLESETDAAQVHQPQQQAEEDEEQAQILQHKIYKTEMQPKNQEDGAREGGGEHHHHDEDDDDGGQLTAGSSSQRNLKSFPPALPLFRHFMCKGGY